MSAPQSEGAPAVELRITAECRVIRNKVGPVAWVLLEELVLTAERGRSLAVVTTVRDLGEAVGLSKDTVTTGLRRLMKVGLVTRAEQRDRLSGCFGNSVYRLHLAGTGVAWCVPSGPDPDPGFSDTVTTSSAAGRSRDRDACPAAIPPCPASVGRPAVTECPGQMSLLDDPAALSVDGDTR